MLLIYQLVAAILAAVALILLYFFLSTHKRQSALINQYEQTFKSFRELYSKSTTHLNPHIMVQELLQIQGMLRNQTSADAVMLFFSSGENDEYVLKRFGDTEPFILPGYDDESKTLDLRNSPFESILEEYRPMILAQNKETNITDKAQTDLNHIHYPFLLIIPVHDNRILLSLIVVARSLKRFTEEERLTVETLSSFYSYLVLSKLSLLDQFERQIVKSKSLLAAEVQSRLLCNKSLELVFASVCMHTSVSEDVHSDYHGYHVDNKFNRVSVYSSDITGRNIHHSPQAMIMIHSLFQILLRSRQEPKKIFKIVNNFIMRDKGIENYVQSAIIQYFGETNTVHYTSAGAGLFLIYRLNSQEVEVMETSDLALGVDEDYTYKTREYKASSGDIFLTCTDGLLETVDERDQLYGKERLIKIVKDNYFHSPEELKEKIFEEQSLFRGRAKKNDDRTVIILKIY